MSEGIASQHSNCVDCRQIGLGPTVTLDAITVPTEVNLWRTTPGTMKTTCRNIFAGVCLEMDLCVCSVRRSLPL